MQCQHMGKRGGKPGGDARCRLGMVEEEEYRVGGDEYDVVTSCSGTQVPAYLFAKYPVLVAVSGRW